MAELTTALSTYAAGPADTALTLSDGVGNFMLAQHINGGLSAIVAMQAALGTGNALKRSKATLAVRLDTCLNANGAINGGTAFPVVPTPVDGQLFWRTDLKQFYVYDGALAQWQRIDGVNDHGLLGGLGDDDHSQYLNNARHDLTARHPKSVISAAGTFAKSDLPSAIAYEDEGNIFSESQKVSKATPQCAWQLRRTDRAIDTGGLWQFAIDGSGNAYIQCNTAAAGDFSTSTFLSLDNTGKMTAGTVPLGRVGVTGSVTFTNVLAGAHGNSSIAHGLGTDSVKTLLAGSRNIDSAISAWRPDGYFTIMVTGGTGGTTSFLPASGNVTIAVRNNTGATDTFPVSYTILRES